MHQDPHSDRLCFYARAGQLKLYVALAKRLTSDGVDACFVTQHELESAYVLSQLPKARVYEVEAFLKEHWHDQGLSDLVELTQAYPDTNLWRMLYADRFLVYYSKADCVKMILLHFRFFETLFATEEPGFFVNEVVAVFAAYVALVVGDAHGVQYVGTIIARDNARNQFYFVNDLYQRNGGLDYLYADGSLSDSELGDASEALKAFRERPPAPAYMVRDKRAPRPRLKMALYPLKFLLERRKAIYRDKISYMSYGRAWEICSPLTRYLQYMRSRKYYQQPIVGEPYYLYTLHFQPEASTLVCAPKYEKQLVAIDHLAKSIPSNSVLYVKEHYAGLGHRELGFYRKLLAYPNVRLIDPYCDIHELIRNSLAVVVLTNTTGFEALLHGKKVFVLGEVFYDRFENVEKLSDVYDNADRLKEVVPEVGDDKIVRFLAAYRKSLYDGCVAPMFPEFLTSENIDALARSFADYLASIRRSSG